MSDDLDLGDLDFDSVEERLSERQDQLDNEEAPIADNDCGDGGCVI